VTFDDRTTRRRFLTAVAAAAASAGVRAETGPTVTAPKHRPSGELTGLTAGEASGLLTRREISAVEYARALLDQCDAGRSLNAFITLRPEQVLAAAR
jgi:hypothetical protein